MKFDKAFKELIKLADGKPCSLEYQNFKLSSSIVLTDISAYIEGLGHTDDFQTFKQALSAMQKKIKPKKVKLDKPKIDDGEKNDGSEKDGGKR